MSQKQVKRSSKGLGVGAAKKKISLSDKENINLATNQCKGDRKLILEQRYSLHAEHVIAIGIDPTTNFNVVIRLINFVHAGGVQLDIAEFEELLRSQNSICNGLKESEPVMLLECVNIQETKIVKIVKNNETHSFDLGVMQQMFKMSYIFRYYINMLKSINFSEFFNDVMTTAFNTQLNIDILNLLDQMTNIDGGIKFLGIKEMLIFYPEFVYNGLVDAVTTNIVL